ncbi:MAG: ABC transporter permease [Bacteroidota bacterium]
MLKNYLIISFRNLFRHRFFSILNIAGLAVGMTASILLYFYVDFHQSFDRFQVEGDRTFRVYNQGAEFSSAQTPPGLVPILQHQFPEIESAARLSPSQGVISFPAQDLSPTLMNGQPLLCYADADAPSLIGMTIAYGEGNLQAPNRCLLSEEQAKKWYGEAQEAIGKVLAFTDQFGEIQYEVMGVFNDFPINSHIRPGVLISHHHLASKPTPWADYNGFNWSSFYTYLRLNEGGSPQDLEEKIAQFKDQHFPQDSLNQLKLQALTDIHLRTDLVNDRPSNISAYMTSFMLALAVFILLIAWINYINLATAKATQRAEEVGVRKTVGASRSQLVVQFLLESLLLNFCAAVLGLLLVDLAYPYFAELMGLPAALDIWAAPGIWALYFCLFIISGLASGAYPAFILSGYTPASVLKGQASLPGKGINLRKALVVLQFAISLVLMAGTTAVYFQVDYTRQQHLALNADQKCIIPGPQVQGDSTYGVHLKTFKEELRSIPQIKQMAVSNALPGLGYNFGTSIRTHQQSPEQKQNIMAWWIDEAFVPAYGLPLLAGRNFSIERDGQNQSVILNEKAIEVLGFSSGEEAIGKKVKVNLYQEEDREIIGVVQNYHHLSLHENFEPEVMFFSPYNDGYFTLEIAGNDLPKTLPQVEQLFASLFPSSPFSYQFLDEIFDRQYQADQELGYITAGFSILAIFIACLGLLGLSTFSTLQRTKEIGIRKIMGASIPSIIMLLSKEFIGLILLASVFALPIAYYGINWWLSSFAFRIPIGLGLFLLPTLLILLLAFATISQQTLKSASANPIDALRYE